MTGLVLYPLLTCTLWYLGTRAVITSWLWSRYPPRLARFMDCSACAGFWYGFAVAALFRWPFLGLHDWWTPVIVGLCSITWTPIGSSAAQRALESLGTAVEGPNGPPEA